MEANGRAESLRLDHVDEPVTVVRVLRSGRVVPPQREPESTPGERGHGGPALCGCDHQRLMLVPLKLDEPDAACCTLSEPAGRGSTLQLLASGRGRQGNRLDEQAL